MSCHDNTPRVVPEVQATGPKSADFNAHTRWRHTRRALAALFRTIVEVPRRVRTMNQLSNLDDHLLKDIGVERQDVLRVRDVLRESCRSFWDECRRLGR